MLKRMEVQIVPYARFGRTRESYKYVTKQSLLSRIWDWLMADV
jgi:hypothetical protein